MTSRPACRIHHLVGETVPAVVALLTVLGDVASKIAAQIPHATHGGLTIPHHAIQPIAIVGMALFVPLEERMEFLVAGELAEFPEASSTFHNSSGFKQRHDDYDAILVQFRRIGD